MWGGDSPVAQGFQPQPTLANLTAIPHLPSIAASSFYILSLRYYSSCMIMIAYSLLSSSESIMISCSFVHNASNTSPNRAKSPSGHPTKSHTALCVRDTPLHTIEASQYRDCQSNTKCCAHVPRRRYQLQSLDRWNAILCSPPKRFEIHGTEQKNPPF